MKNSEEIKKNKASALLKVAELICNNGIEIPEVIEEIKLMMPVKKQIDLAVKLNGGTIIRLPYTEDNCRLNVVGVFPFKTNNHYLKLRQDEYIHANKYAKEDLPNGEFMQKLSSVRKSVNCVLRKLNKPEIDGFYHVDEFAAPAMARMIADLTDKHPFEMRPISLNTPAKALYWAEI